jgi:hypothetical protein
VLFFVEFINVTGLGDLLAVFADVVVLLSLVDEVNGFSSLELEEELVSWVRHEKV